MIQINRDNIVTLVCVKKEEIAQFKKDMQEAFSVAVVESFGSKLEEPIPCDQDIEKSINNKGSVTYHVVLDGKKVGGAILTIDEVNNHNSLDFFFIYVSEHSRGIGEKAWKAIEDNYPNTKVWETHTPYFEKRNIHFYVNKCGFKIVEYFNEFNHDPNFLDNEDIPGGEDFFRFEKIMK